MPLAYHMLWSEGFLKKRAITLLWSLPVRPWTTSLFFALPDHLVYLYQWVTWGGAGFLFFYGFGFLRSALRGGSMDISDRTVRTLKTAIINTLAVTLLNPHFYLDTVILLGSVSSQFHGESRLYFWIGAVSASTLWFITLNRLCNEYLWQNIPVAFKVDRIIFIHFPVYTIWSVERLMR